MNPNTPEIKSNIDTNENNTSLEGSLDYKNQPELIKLNPEDQTILLENNSTKVKQIIEMDELNGGNFIEQIKDFGQNLGELSDLFGEMIFGKDYENMDKSELEQEISKINNKISKINMLSENEYLKGDKEGLINSTKDERITELKQEIEKIKSFM